MSSEGEHREGGGTSGPILVIDDDPAILETVAEILRDEGYGVVTARNGAEGLAAVEQIVPALVLLDRWMPILDGKGFWEGLQQRALRVPVIAMTAAHDAEQWARELGASAVLPKPFKLPVLLKIVEAAIQGE